MKARSGGAILLGAWAIAASAALAAPQPAITHLRLLPLHPGMNIVHGFLPDGGNGAILQAWRDNGNAHGFTKFVVMVPAKGADGQDWNIVGLEIAAHGLDDSIDDIPHTGEDNVRSVRFARGAIDGAIASLLIVAERDLGGAQTYYDPAPTRISIYKLTDASAEGAGTTPFVFRLVRATDSKTLFCNADLALHKALGLPLPADYGGANKIDGCFPGSTTQP